jgi:tetratricopeptide (TPR) repeat protein
MAAGNAAKPTDSVAFAAPPPAAEKDAQAPAQLDAQNVIVTGSNIRRRDAADAPAAAAPLADSSKGAEAEQTMPEASLPPSKAAGSVARAAKAAVPPPEDPVDLEHRAEAARHEGNYALAAGLYREAASSHHYNSKAAAWDLAHAVECLAASGSFDEARGVRDQLQRVFPTEITAFAAARRALREVDVNPSK